MAQIIPLLLLFLLAGTCLFYRNESERRSREKQLHIDTIKFQANIIDSIHEGVFSIDLGGHITSWNKEAEKLMGYSADEVMGKPLKDLCPEIWNQHVQESLVFSDSPLEVYEGDIKLRRKNRSKFMAHVSLSMLRGESGSATGITGYCMDISGRVATEQQLACRIHQQAGIAELGQHALLDISVDELLDRAVGLVAGVLRVELTKILELSDDKRTLLLKAGEGWHEGLVGKAVVSAKDDSQAAYTLGSKKPVIVYDLKEESRFSGPQLLFDHDVVSGMSVMIHGKEGPYGIFGVHSKERRKFTHDDVNFLRTVSNILAEAIERRQAEESILKSESRFRSIVDATNDCIWEVDRYAGYTYVSPQIQNMLGYKSGDVIGKTPFDHMPPDEAERMASLFKSSIGDHSSIYSVENINQHQEGHLVVLESSAVPIIDVNGELQGYRGISRDITDRKKDEQHLEQLAHYDYLTGLPNRALFFDRLHQSLARAPWHNRMLAVMFLDLDRFKVINDTLGHDTGDRLLVEVADRVSRSFRDGDTVARLGGDEFAIILDDMADNRDIYRLAQSVRASLEKPFVIKGRELYISASIGISCFPADGEDSRLLVTRADIAMYHAKSEGRNNCQFYSESMDAMAADRLHMETRLRHALERGEYFIHYQPKLDLVTGNISGMEALARWRTADRGVIPPIEFIPLLEDSGMIVQVGEWILKNACQQTMRWHKAGYKGISVSVNLSARQFKHGNLEETVVWALQDSGLDPDCLELEITESILMENLEETTEVLSKLSGIGIRIVIDDFGTGYSSLSYLKQFPISTLKIDRSFISGVTNNEEDAALTQAIIAMSHNLGIKVIAEGAEEKAQVDFLKEAGCDELQGYYYSKPLESGKMKVFLSKNYYVEDTSSAVEAGLTV